MKSQKAPVAGDTQVGDSIAFDSGAYASSGADPAARARFWRWYLAALLFAFAAGAAFNLFLL